MELGGVIYRGKPEMGRWVARSELMAFLSLFITNSEPEGKGDLDM